MIRIHQIGNEVNILGIQTEKKKDKTNRKTRHKIRNGCNRKNKKRIHQIKIV